MEKDASKNLTFSFIYDNNIYLEREKEKEKDNKKLFSSFPLLYRSLSSSTIRASQY
jgi:hypothetical protein